MAELPQQPRMFPQPQNPQNPQMFPGGFLGGQGGEAAARLGFEYGQKMLQGGQEQLGKYLQMEGIKSYFNSWKRRQIGRGDKLVMMSPRDDDNAPDLYIPIMAFVTYVLLVALATATRSEGGFHPSVLGKLFTKGIIALVLEVSLTKLGVYLLDVTSVSLWDIISYCSYKYIGIVLGIVSGLIAGKMVYYVIITLLSAFTGIFLIKTLRLAVLPDVTDMSIGQNMHRSRRQYFLVVLAVLQIPISLFLGQEMGDNNDKLMLISFLRDVLYPANLGKCIQSDFPNLLSWASQIQEIVSETDEKIITRWIGEYEHIDKFLMPISYKSLSNTKRLVLQILLKSGHLSPQFLQIILNQYLNIVDGDAAFEKFHLSALALDLGEIVSEEAESELNNNIFLTKWISENLDEPIAIPRHFTRQRKISNLIKKSLTDLREVEVDTKLKELLPISKGDVYAWEVLWMLLVISPDQNVESDQLNQRICEFMLQQCSGGGNSKIELSPPFTSNGYILSTVSEAYFTVASRYVSELVVVWGNNSSNDSSSNATNRTEALNDVHSRIKSLWRRPRMRVLLQPVLIDLKEKMRNEFIFDSVLDSLL